MSEKPSKRQRKRQAEQTRPRSEYVVGHATETVSSITVQFEPSGQINILEMDPASLQRQVAYERQNKSDEKVLYLAPAKDFSHSRSRFADLQDQFDYLLAVDTNTVNGIHRGHRISVCSIYCLRDQLKSLSGEVPIIPVACYVIADPEHNAVAEPLGWHLAITRHAANALQASKRVGLVVDHDRKSHIAINAGRTPYFGNHYLPEGLALVYASDKSTETIANVMLRYCHKSADRVKALVPDGSIERYLQYDPIRIGAIFCYPFGPEQASLMKPGEN